MRKHAEKGWAASEEDLAFTQSYARRIHIHLARHNWQGAIKIIKQCQAACNLPHPVIPPALLKYAALIPREIVDKLLSANFQYLNQVIIASDDRLLMAGLCSREIVVLDHSLGEYCLCRDPELEVLLQDPHHPP